jgi:ATP-dependent Clp protease ATP-binding subunit ClpC
LKKTFRPEFLNRIDEVIVFHSLEQEHLQEIVDLMLQEVLKRLEDYDMKLVVSQEAKEFLAKEGFDPTFGARPLRRVIQKYIENDISEEMLKGNFRQGETIFATIKDGKLLFATEDKALKQ